MKKTKLVKLVRRLEKELDELRDAHLRIAQKHREEINNSHLRIMGLQEKANNLEMRIEALKGKMRENDLQHNMYQRDLSNLNKIINSSFGYPQIINKGKDGTAIDNTPIDTTPITTWIKRDKEGDFDLDLNKTDSITVEDVIKVWDSLTVDPKTAEEKLWTNWVFSDSKKGLDFEKYVRSLVQLDPDEKIYTHTFSFYPSLVEEYRKLQNLYQLVTISNELSKKNKKENKDG